MVQAGQIYSVKHKGKDILIKVHRKAKGIMLKYPNIQTLWRIFVKEGDEWIKPKNDLLFEVQLVMNCKLISSPKLKKQRN